MLLVGRHLRNPLLQLFVGFGFGLTQFLLGRGLIAWLNPTPIQSDLPRIEQKTLSAWADSLWNRWAACERAIAKDAFYNKNMCLRHRLTSVEEESDAKLEQSTPSIRKVRDEKSKTRKIVNEKLIKLNSTLADLPMRKFMIRELMKEWQKTIDFSGQAVFAKLENTERCTLDGHDEQIVAMCNGDGRTNSSQPMPGQEAYNNVFSKLDQCLPIRA